MRTRVLITAKTYPRPSKKYDEVVCTAGIDLQSRRFIRLHPVRFRYMDYGRQFSKYDILELELHRRSQDSRCDTYTPVMDSIQRVGHIETRSSGKLPWAERNEIVLPLATTLEELMERAKSNECSLGIVRMQDVRFEVDRDSDQWSDQQLMVLSQQNLLGKDLAPLEKVPWKFFFRFRCSERCRGHRLQFLDWEASALSRNMRDKHGSDEAIEKVKHAYSCKYREDTHDLHMFVGTHFKHRDRFMAIGLYYPPRSKS
jgi:hypothetical protein